MLIRIVKMNFRPEKVYDFISVFQERKHLIASSAGCAGVELLRDISNPNVFFTYSKWQDETSLENYRQSELFNEVWSEVKKWFAAKPEAWSVEEFK
jgi:quinol monooxygenase YgiN